MAPTALRRPSPEHGTERKGRDGRVKTSQGGLGTSRGDPSPPWEVFPYSRHPHGGSGRDGTGRDGTVRDGYCTHNSMVQVAHIVFWDRMLK